MPPPTSYSPLTPRPPIDKAALLVAITASLLLVETLSGALRYYFELAGVGWLLYLPKLACLAAVGLELPKFKAHPGVWLVLLLCLFSSQLALLHGATLANVGFSLFACVPLLFGVVCGKYLFARARLLAWVIGLCLAASYVGIALDLSLSVPWKGYSYVMGDVEISGNKEWTDGGIDRIAGFARMSSILAVMIALYTLYLAARCHSSLLRLPLYGAALVGIYLTTNKSALIALLLTLLMMIFRGCRVPTIAALLIAVLVGMALPVASLLVDIDPTSVAGASDHVFASFNDRLANSWPNFVAVMADEGWALWGAGFGTVGSTQAVFPIYGLELLGIADNTALYLWGVFGVFGPPIYLLLLALMLRLHDRGLKVDSAQMSIVFCICLVAWATDVLEIAVSSLFLGLATARALVPIRVAKPAPSKIVLGQFGDQPG